MGAKVKHFIPNGCGFDIMHKIKRAGLSIFYGINLTYNRHVTDTLRGFFIAGTINHVCASMVKLA